MDCNVAFLDPCHTPPACNPRKESIRGEENIGREAKYPLQRQGILYERILSFIVYPIFILSRQFIVTLTYSYCSISSNLQ